MRGLVTSKSPAVGFVTSTSSVGTQPIWPLSPSVTALINCRPDYHNIFLIHSQVQTPKKHPRENPWISVNVNSILLIKVLRQLTLSVHSYIYKQLNVASTTYKTLKIRVVITFCFCSLCSWEIRTTASQRWYSLITNLQYIRVNAIFSIVVFYHEDI